MDRGINYDPARPVFLLAFFVDFLRHFGSLFPPCYGILSDSFFYHVADRNYFGVCIAHFFYHHK